MSTATRVIKNTGWLYAKMGITMFISLYTTRLILNSLGASDFGIFNVVGGAISMLGFLNAAMASATQRFMSYAEGAGDKEKQKSIFNVSILLHLAMAFVVGFVLLGAGWFFFHGILQIPPDRVFAAKVVYASLVVSTMLTIVNVPYDAVINAHENMRYFAMVGILESFLKLAVAFACVYVTSDKLIVYGVLMASIPLVTLTIMKVYCHRRYEECIIRPRHYFNKTLTKEMTSFAGWNFITAITSLLSHQGVNLVLNHYFGTIVNAAQGITYQLSGQLGALSTQATKSLNPIIVKDAGRQQNDAMYRAASMGSKVTFFITSVIFIPFLLNAEAILKTWLVNIPEYTVLFVILYFTVNLLNTLVMFFSTAISGVGRIRQSSLTNSLIEFIPFVGSMILFSLGYPPYSVYVLMIVAAVLKLLSRVYYSYKLCGFSLCSILIDDIARPVACFCATILAGLFLKSFFTAQIMFLIVYSLLMVLLYSSLYLYFGLTDMEKDKVREIIQYVRNRTILKN